MSLGILRTKNRPSSSDGVQRALTKISLPPSSQTSKTDRESSSPLAVCGAGWPGSRSSGRSAGGTSRVTFWRRHSACKSHQGGVRHLLMPIRAGPLERPRQFGQRHEEPHRQGGREPGQGEAATPPGAEDRAPLPDDGVGAEPGKQDQRRQRPSLQQVVRAAIAVERQKQQRRNAGEEEGLPAQPGPHHAQQQGQQRELRHVQHRQPGDGTMAVHARHGSHPTGTCGARAGTGGVERMPRADGRRPVATA